nr:hypothetical protein JEDKAPMP_00094 [Cydia pomonella granulovirus]
MSNQFGAAFNTLYQTGNKQQSLKSQLDELNRIKHQARVKLRHEERLLKME